MEEWAWRQQRRDMSDAVSLRRMADKAWEDGDKDISENLHELARKLENKEKTDIKFYVHSSKDDNHTYADELGLSEKARENFKYAGYEIELDCSLDRETGEVYATHVNGIALIEGVKI